MSEWIEVALSEIADIRFSNVDKKAISGETPVRLCNYMDVYSNNYITGALSFMEATAGQAEIHRFRVERGDVIVTKDSETPDDIGIPTVVIDAIPDLVCGYHLALIKPDPEKIDSTYLAKQLGSTSVASRFSRLANGSTRYGLSSSAISSTSIPLAPPKQQRRIAEILTTLDEAIEATEALIAKHQQIKAGLMHDLFTHGVTPDGRLRPTRERAPNLYKESPLGWLPKDWGTVTVRQVCDTASGGTPSRAVAAFWNGSIPWVKTGEIRYRLIRDTEEKITENGLHYSAAKILRAGTILMALFGQGPTRGRVAVLGVDAAVNQACLALIPTSKIENLFLYYSFVYGYDDLRKLSNDGAQQNLNADLVKNFPLKLPAGDEQKRIVGILESRDLVVEREQKQLKKLQQQKFGLMHDLLTGRVRVKVGQPV